VHLRRFPGGYERAAEETVVEVLVTTRVAALIIGKDDPGLGELSQLYIKGVRQAGLP
jgi:hypothetical protein